MVKAIVIAITAVVVVLMAEIGIAITVAIFRGAVVAINRVESCLVFFLPEKFVFSFL